MQYIIIVLQMTTTKLITRLIFEKAFKSMKRIKMFKKYKTGTMKL